MAYKVFTNGSVLNASEINDNLMRQSVMVFSNAAARTAAITSPVEGMLTYLEDTNRYEHWNSSSWVSPFGLTLLNTTSFTSATTVAVDNVFTSAFTNYRVVIDSTSSSAGSLNLKFRLSGTPSSVNYNWSGIEVRNGTGPTRLSGLSSTSFKIGTAADSMATFLDISAPALARASSIFANSQAYSGSLIDNWASIFSGTHTPATAYDGFELISASSLAMTGSVRTYGYRNVA